MSQDPLHQSEGTHDEWLQRTFDEWDAGEPSMNTWEEIEASLSVESVWERVGQSLTAEEHAQDQWITASHNAWEPQQQHDGWARLNDAISLEQVWRDLDHSLGQPVRTRIPVWKLAAACVASLFMVQHFSDAPVPQEQTAFAVPAGTTTPVFIDSPVTATPSAPVAQAGQHTANKEPDHIVVPQQQYSNDEMSKQQPGIQQIESGNDPINNAAQQQAVQQSQENEQLLAAESEDPTNDLLAKRSWELAPGQVYPSAIPERLMPFKNWTVQLGTQLSVLEQREQGVLTSTLPRLTLAADVSYRHHAGPVQFIYAFGLSQYSQRVSDFKRGHFEKTVQHINTLQLTTSIGYSYKRFTFYGGFLVSKGLNGLERDADTKVIKKVYDLNGLQTGFTGGIDFRLKTYSSSGNYLSIGSQYQWMPSYSTGEDESFENIHGIRLQAKFSF